jgi:hypothetical protein
MIAPSAWLLNSRLTFHVGGFTVGARGGIHQTYDDAGTVLSAYVEAQTSGGTRTDQAGSPLARKLYNIYTGTVNPGAVIDSHFVWDSHGQTFAALGPSQDLSGAGVNWVTECQELT